MAQVSEETRLQALVSLNLLDLLARVRDEHPDIDETDPTMFETAMAEIHGNVVRHGRPLPGRLRGHVDRAAGPAGRLPRPHR